jgi:hypothetical protein
MRSRGDLSKGDVEWPNPRPNGVAKLARRAMTKGARTAGKRIGATAALISGVSHCSASRAFRLRQAFEVRKTGPMGKYGGPMPPSEISISQGRGLHCRNRTTPKQTRVRH